MFKRILLATLIAIGCAAPAFADTNPFSLDLNASTTIVNNSNQTVQQYQVGANGAYNFKGNLAGLQALGNFGYIFTNQIGTVGNPRTTIPVWSVGAGYNMANTLRVYATYGVQPTYYTTLLNQQQPLRGVNAGVSVTI